MMIYQSTVNKLHLMYMSKNNDTKCTKHAFMLTTQKSKLKYIIESI